ncbi:hypothetical protein Y032_0042g538 [Ancylostoma ceylanicum]|uniref:Uncharacterized protein n=1 Tax=Ancylostoma ceylanicum TaxID=53326 RepID=A0A016UFV7_9BILA|nr:hypothetical protein Y032_0042g538 [Ancylostoma ceylanicum]
MLGTSCAPFLVWRSQICSDFSLKSLNIAVAGFSTGSVPSPNELSSQNTLDQAREAARSTVEHEISGLFPSRHKNSSMGGHLSANGCKWI